MQNQSQSTAAQRLAQRGIVLLMCVSLGMHWTVLQGIAWTQMLISYASEGTLAEAVEKTFDGEHPCPLCKKVQEGQQQHEDDSTPVAAKSLKKFEAVLVAQTRVVPPPAVIRSFPESVSSFEGWHDVPPTPPPRGAAV